MFESTAAQRKRSGNRIDFGRGHELLCWSDLDARRVTAGSHIPGTERSSAVTSGHAGVEIGIQEELGEGAFHFTVRKPAPVRGADGRAPYLCSLDAPEDSQ